MMGTLVVKGLNVKFPQQAPYLTNLSTHSPRYMKSVKLVSIVIVLLGIPDVQTWSQSAVWFGVGFFFFVVVEKSAWWHYQTSSYYSRKLLQDNFISNFGLCPKQFDVWKVHEKSIWVKRSSFVNSGSVLGIVLLKMVFSLKVTKNVNTTWQPALWHLIKLSYFCQIVFRRKGCWTHLIVSFQKKFLGSILRTFEEILKKPLLGGSKTLLSCGIFIKSQQRLI